MRKRILCTALLSLLALWVMALPAMAADKNYYKLNSVTAGTKSYAFDAYAASVTLPTGDNALKVTLKAGTKVASSVPSGYVDANSVAWTAAVSPESMKDGNITCTTTPSTLKADALEHTITLAGKVKGSCTITVTATLGTGATAQTKTATIKITVPDKPAPEISAGEDAAEFSGEAMSALSLKDSSGTAITGNKITFNSYPETIEIDPPSTTLNSTYGVTVTAGAYDASKATAATTRDVTFASTANNVKKITDGVTITVTAYNNKADGTKGTEVKKQVKLVVTGIKPTAWEKEAGGKKK